MTRSRFRGAGMIVLLAALVPAARAVYAPIPQVEQGKALTVYVSGGVVYDTNIFGAETGAIQSLDIQFSPALAFNASLTPQTFGSFNYRLTLDEMPDRPGKKLLDSHELVARIAHTFSPDTDLDLSDTFQLSKNPESLLPGIGTVVSGDQSFRRNQADARLSTTLTRRNGIVFKLRLTTFAYNNDALAQELDRNEFLSGIAISHTVLPTLKSLLEYRYQDIKYDTAGEVKDKQSNFLLTGVDYALNEQVAASIRVGAEYRQRKGDRDALAPYVEIGGKRDYGKGSFVAAGYSHSYEENSTIELFTDSVVDRFFVNWQQVLTPKFMLTGSVDWEPATLEGRRGISPNRRETDTRVGLALVYHPLNNWSMSATVDVDRIHSQQPGRSLSRQRYGVTARYAF